MEHVPNYNSQILVIFGRPLSTIIDAVICIRNDIITMAFGNMTLTIKIFSHPNQQEGEDSTDEVHSIYYTESFEFVEYKQHFIPYEPGICELDNEISEFLDCIDVSYAEDDYHIVKEWVSLSEDMELDE